MQAYYFGCWSPQKPGHFLYYPDGTSVSMRRENAMPIRAESLDGSLLNGVPDVPGNAVLFHGRGWTILSFWDRSGDKRGASNSTFLMRGTMTFEQAVEAAKQVFPLRWALIDFPIIEFPVSSNPL